MSEKETIEFNLSPHLVQKLVVASAVASAAQPILPEPILAVEAQTPNVAGPYVVVGTDEKIDAFLKAYFELCKQHNITLAHEDGQGCFLIEDFDDRNIEWVCSARDERSKTKKETV